MRLSLVVSFIVVLFTFGPCPDLSFAQEVMIKDVVVTNSDTDLLLYLNVVGGFTPEIVEGVQNGLPAVFTFEIRLTMVRSGWPDKEIYSGSVDHRMTYDNLKKSYAVVIGERNDKQLFTDSLATAESLMEELNGFPLISLDTLVPDREYVLEVRAVLAKKTLPFYVHYLIPFGDFWDFTTDWYTVRFKY